MKFIRIAQLVLIIPLMLVAIGYSLPPSSVAEAEINIYAEPKHIFELISHPDNHPQWASWAYQAGQQTHVSTQITSSVPYKFLTGELRVDERPAANYKFTVYNNKTNSEARVVFQYQTPEQGPWDRLFAAMFGSAMQSNLEASLIRLKSVAEAETI